MEIALVILAFLLLAAGILGTVLPPLPGPPLSYAGLLLLQWSGYGALNNGCGALNNGCGALNNGCGAFSVVFLLVWAGITVMVTVADYFLPAILAKRFGGSRFAVIGSFIGLAAGIFFFPPWGMIAGPFFGALAGELIHDIGGGKKALKAAFGAFLAFIVGSGAKLIASSLMMFYAVKAML
jgi:uncharacterized protein YqgC (DUF456 family)